MLKKDIMKIIESIAKEYINDISTNCSILAKKYKTNRVTIKRCLREYGVNVRNNYSLLKRSYRINENYFDTINTEDKAYFLGLLYADGCNVEDKNLVTISLQINDRDILEKFKSHILTQAPIKIKKLNNPKWKDAVRLDLWNSHLSKQLSVLGCTERKSLILKFPNKDQVPEHLIRHFIRGYFDGDGSISLNRNMYRDFSANCTIVSSTYFCRELGKILLSLNIYNKLYQNKRNPKTTCLHISRIKDARKFLDWIYEDATVFMNRKHNEYLNLINGKTNLS